MLCDTLIRVWTVIHSQSSLCNEGDKWRLEIDSRKFKLDFTMNEFAWSQVLHLSLRQKAFWFLETFRYLGDGKSTVDWCYKYTISLIFEIPLREKLCCIQSFVEGNRWLSLRSFFLHRSVVFLLTVIWK